MVKKQNEILLLQNRSILRYPDLLSGKRVTVQNPGQFCCQISWRATLQGEDALSDGEWSGPPAQLLFKVRWDMMSDGLRLTFTFEKDGKSAILSDGLAIIGCVWFSFHKKMENLLFCQMLWGQMAKPRWLASDFHFEKDGESAILSDAAGHSRRSHQSVWCTRSRSSL